ncbi:ATP-binding cassette domain-containing protein [Brevibacillus daliensis]|uniref:ATP-binding cassette domain-containing protein n=1 Tax=Brevibacillus daliensis TaxID=2892995 RepID=UPI001E5D0E9C|nr:ATP-binding cassette domain-containing protein [Brevibacillus daliensis]
MKRSQKIGFFILVIFVFIAIFGPMIATHTPFAIDGESMAAPSEVNWFGTNKLGQDLFSQFVYGARTTLLIGLAVALISTTLSAILGLLAGYSSKLDTLLNSIANMLMVLPSLLLILIVASFSGGGTWQLIWTLGLLTWPGYMRLIRASVLSLKEREFVKAAQLYQGNTFYIIRKHLLPFIWPLIKTKFIISFQAAVAMEASLSFLGIGDPNVPSWGKMLQDVFSQSSTLLTDSWKWTVVPPTLAILFVTTALALLGESKQDGTITTASLRRKKSKVLPPVVCTAGEVASSGMSAISVKNLSVVYGDRTIIHPLSFEVTSGNVTALIGESGSGKTTMARTLYGLLPEETVTGEAYVAGKRIYRGEGQVTLQRWLDAAYIFQDPRSSFDPLLKIGKQFYEAMLLYHTPIEKREAAAQILREVQLDEAVLDCYPHELSGGMLGRALLALALVNKPSVLIADEPTSALDPIVKREVLDLLIKKVREHHMTLLLITHDLSMALHVADEILLLQDGHLVAEKDKQRYLQRYKPLSIRQLGYQAEKTWEG